MRETLQPYEKYRDSGFQWLGEIPDHWEVKKFNHIADIVEGQVDPKEKPYQDYVLVAPNHIESGTGRLICQETALEQGAISGKYLFQSGDIVYSKIRPALRKVWKADIPGICSADMYPIRLSKKKIDPAYFTFLCLSESFSGFMIATSMRVAMPKVNRNDFHECHFIIPPISEQKAIANYLDTKTTQIDRKIDLLIQKAERYEELKKSLINEVVMGKRRVIDNGELIMENEGSENCQLSTVNYPLYKDSGIDWIGEIPEHWEIKRIKDIILSLESGVSVNATNEPAEEQEIGILKTSCVSKLKFDPNENKAILKEEASRAKCQPRRGNIIISRMNTPELVGASGYVDRNYQNLYLPDRLWQTVFSSRGLVFAKWLSYLLKLTNLRKAISSLATGASSSMKNLPQDKFMNVAICVPAILDQEEIANYLDTKTAQIDQIIQAINTQIEKQKELRKTLINDVVTGKIKIIDNGE